jgi:mRNA interferase YafQ
MRTIKRTGAFRRDYKRVKTTPKHRGIENDLALVLGLLIDDKPLPSKYCDHPLSGNWKDHRDCHVKPDLLLIYRKPDDDTLQLVRLGSHSELSL